MSADYIRAVPTINLADDELAAVTAAIGRAIEDDRYPHAPRLDPLRAALGKFEAAGEPTPPPKAPTVTVGKRARRTRLRRDRLRIAISQAAFDAICATLPLGSAGYENKIDEHGNRLIWLPRAVLDRLNHLRGASESYTDVILRTADRESFSG